MKIHSSDKGRPVRMTICVLVVMVLFHLWFATQITLISVHGSN